MDFNKASSTVPIQFNGKAGEYFGIWIVNVCLTLITLGIYSPWAKIRKKRYFYGSTTVAGASFDYVANPIAILKGRLIAVALLVGIGIIGEFVSWVKHFWSFTFLFLWPWVIIHTLRFNAINTLHRNLRFDFKADYWPTMVSFVGRPLLVPFTLGLALPWVVQRQKQFTVEHYSYGNSAFHLDASVSDFIAIYKRIAFAVFKGFFLFFLLQVILTLACINFTMVTHFNEPSNYAYVQCNSSGLPGKMIVVLPLLWVMGVSVYANVLTTNLVWSKTTLRGIGFDCELRFWRLFYLQVTNLLCIIFSLGLLIPWASIRLTRYRLSCMALRCTAEQLQGFTAGQTQNVGAFGEELSGFLDMDIGF